MRKVLLASGFLFLLSAAHAQNRAMSFDGVDDHVDCGGSPSFTPASIQTFECWVKFNSLAGAQEILSKSIGGQGLELLLFGGDLRVYAMFDPGNYSFLSYSTSSFRIGAWYHLAFTWNGTRESMQLYVNGVPVGTRTDAGNINLTGVANPACSFRIGQWSDISSRPFNGAVDEVRVWNVSRTATQIKDGMLGGVASSSSGLIASYAFNEASGNALNGTATPGLDGVPVNGAVRTGSSVGFANNALNFDGDNDQVVVAPNSLFDLSTGTVEFLIRPSSMGINGCIGGVRGTGGTRFSFHMNTSNNTLGMWNNAQYNTVTYGFVPGSRYHLAFVCDGMQTQVYINGSHAGTLNSAFGNLTGQPLVFGLAKNNVGDGEPFAGDVDEVRIWNTERTAAQIAANKEVGLSGKEAGLVALYNFNMGNASGSNGWMTTAFDHSPNHLHGTIANFAMTGSSSNYVGNVLTVLPVTYAQFGASRENARVRLHWQTASEQNSARFIVERSLDGRSYASIGTVAAAGQAGQYTFFDLQPSRSVNYYRLRHVDLDGREQQSSIALVAAEGGASSLAVSVAGSAVRLDLPGGGSASFLVSDLSGRVLQRGKLSAGRATLNLKPGLYLVAVSGQSLRFLVP